MDEEDYWFFDARDRLSPEPDNVSGLDEAQSSSRGINGFVSNGFEYDVWIRSPESVQERRNEFFRLMGLSSDGGIAGDNSVDDFYSDIFRGEFNRIMKPSGTVLRSPNFEDEFSSSRSSVSSLPNDCSDLPRGSGSSDDFVCSVPNSHGCKDCPGERELAMGSKGNGDSSGSAHLVQKLVERQLKIAGTMARKMTRVKSKWLNRLRSMSCIVDTQGISDVILPSTSEEVRAARIQRVSVRQNKKRLKELSALFIKQNIPAHKGSILTMKFSLDGHYLASAGEDSVVRIWQVVEDERSDEVDIPGIDPSCLYFTVDHLSELAPLKVEKEKMSMLKSLRKTADSACVIFPQKFFRILEKPIHEFHGHCGDILDLSWSNKNYLLSSSVDETVRLWQVGNDQCLKVFKHSNYVTCVQFNPVDDNYFISGSVDGKVRIWSLTSSQVADWTDVREIVTAVTYGSDGQGGIIGSVNGACHFFSLLDNQFKLEAQVYLNGKRKSSSRRVIGFQFFPQDPSKVMVTCADSYIRILHGIDVIGKFRGLRNSGNQISTFFTPDGKHIISACEDSNVYVWNCENNEENLLSQPKTIRSFECFSSDASVALPWPGLDYQNGQKLEALDESLPNSLSLSSSTCFSFGREFFLESIWRGSATWPEENLPSPDLVTKSPPMGKPQYRFFKSSLQSLAECHAWGLVIVTAGWDGRIRSFHNYGLPVPL